MLFLQGYSHSWTVSPAGWGNKYTAVAKAVSVCRELQVENTEAQEGLQAEPALTDTMVYPGLHCRLP